MNRVATGTALKIKDVELSGKSGTAQVIGYTRAQKFGSRKGLTTTVGSLVMHQDET